MTISALVSGPMSVTTVLLVTYSLIDAEASQTESSEHIYKQRIPTDLVIRAE